MYSQNNEDDLILDYFGDKSDGTFLDIGAHDGKTFSNTLALIERGWSGVMVEPSPGAFSALLRHHGGNEKLSLVNAAIDEDYRWRVFHDADGDMVGSLNCSHVNKWSCRVNFNKFSLQTVGYAQLSYRYGEEFDFISIDTEGESASLFCDMVGLFRAQCWCIEHDSKTDQIVSVAERLGLKQLAWNQENIILVPCSE